MKVQNFCTEGLSGLDWRTFVTIKSTFPAECQGFSVFFISDEKKEFVVEFLGTKNVVGRFGFHDGW